MLTINFEAAAYIKCTNIELEYLTFTTFLLGMQPIDFKF